MASWVLDPEQIFTDSPRRHIQQEWLAAAPKWMIRMENDHTVRPTMIVQGEKYIDCATRKKVVPVGCRVFSVSSSPVWGLLREIDKMKWLGHDWNGYGSPPPNDLASQLGELVVLSSKSGRVPTRVVPSAQGGVSVYFVHNRKRGDIECLNSGSMTATLFADGQLPNVWEIKPGEIKQTLEKISHFIES